MERQAVAGMMWNAKYGIHDFIMAQWLLRSAFFFSPLVSRSRIPANPFTWRGVVFVLGVLGVLNIS